MGRFNDFSIITRMAVRTWQVAFQIASENNKKYDVQILKFVTCVDSRRVVWVA